MFVDSEGDDVFQWGVELSNFAGGSGLSQVSHGSHNPRYQCRIALLAMPPPLAMLAPLTLPAPLALPAFLALSASVTLPGRLSVYVVFQGVRAA
eukprot:scaffold320239_cov21-Tisochrysis_lutea.AAC.2